MDIRYWILSLTTRCNLSCAYCYAGAGAKGTDMSRMVLDACLEKIGHGTGPVHVQLTGGEPCLVPELVEKAVQGLRSSGRACSIGIQTNGTLLTPELARLFKDRDIQVGVSLDGPPAVHESLRGKAGRTLGGLRLLEDLQVPFRVTTVVSKQNVRCLDQLVWILAGFKMARGLGLDLLVEKGRAGKKGPVRPAGEAGLKTGLGNMIQVLQAANQRRSLPLSLREAELLRSRRDKPDLRPFCHAAQGKSAAVHPDGSLFPCGQTLGDPDFRAGSIWRPDGDGLKRLTGFRLSSWACAQCPIALFCPGDCPSRLNYNPSRTRPLVCVLYRILWETGLGKI